MFMHAEGLFVIYRHNNGGGGSDVKGVFTDRKEAQKEADRLNGSLVLKDHMKGQDRWQYLYEVHTFQEFANRANEEGIG